MCFQSRRLIAICSLISIGLLLFVGILVIIIKLWSDLDYSNYPAFPRYISRELVGQSNNSGVQSNIFHRPCTDSKGPEESDLCAQWIAAASALDAAKLAKWQFFLSLAGIIGLVATLWFNKRAIDIALDGGMDTEKALSIAAENALHAQQGAEAMRSLALVSQAQLAHSEKISKIQSRAYVLVTSGKTTALDKNLVQIKMFYQNKGNTPAYNIKEDQAVVIKYWPFDIKNLPPLEGVALGKSVSFLGWGDIHSKNQTIKMSENIDDINNGTKCLVIYGKITYDDIFLEQHEIKYCYFVGGAPGISRAIDDDGTSICNVMSYSEGNSVT